MSALDPSGSDWSPIENDLIVADYFNMLSFDLAGKHYVKSDHNAALQRITGRSRGSIEFKHHNISAVLLELGLPWIPGYKPMKNYQNALLDGIERQLSKTPEPHIIPQDKLMFQLSEEPGIIIESPPELITSTQQENAALRRLVGKFDPAARDARNRKLGKMGENLVFNLEQIKLSQLGFPELARKVRWISEEDGDGAGFDILSYDHLGKERLLEVKTTIGGQVTPFFMSENERVLSTERPDSFRLVRLYDFSRRPRAFELTPPLENSVLLRPANYRASFS